MAIKLLNYFEAVKTLIVYTLKGGINMLDMYVALVMAGRRTCNPDNKVVKLVPSNWRSLVAADLESLGLDLDGKPIVTE